MPAIWHRGFLVWFRICNFDVEHQSVNETDDGYNYKNKTRSCD